MGQPDLSYNLDEVLGVLRDAALQLPRAGLQGRRVGYNQHVVSYIEQNVRAEAIRTAQTHGNNESRERLKLPEVLQSDRMSLVTW